MSKTVYEEMFGTPEAAARFMVYNIDDVSKYCPVCIAKGSCECGFDFDKMDSVSLSSKEYDTMLEEMNENCYHVMLEHLNSVAD